MRDEREDTCEQMDDEMRQLVRNEATKRPITEDEATAILWHMGIQEAKP